jgi:hypothetical protein
LPTLRDIAERADVPVEGVVRALMGGPVGDDIAARVRRAVDDLGSPHPSMFKDLNTADTGDGPAEGELIDEAPRKPAAEVVPRAVQDAVEQAREHLLAAFAHAAAELEATLPQGVTSVVYEALRVEVEPMNQRVAQMGRLVEELTRFMRRLADEVTAERHDRLEDVMLLSELLVASWQSVDRRLGRIERILEQETDRDRRLT